MSNKPLGVDVARCRASMATLLTKTVEMTCKLERRLDVTGGWREATAEIDIDADPAATLRIVGALLLRKARIHTVAVLQANETRNLHSLAVQMRPVLECTGQVVFFFQNAIIEPNAEEFGHRVNVDHYQTLRRRTKGTVSAEKLREVEAQAQELQRRSSGRTKPKRRKGRRFTKADQVAILAKGPEWYGYLSELFSHGRVGRLEGAFVAGWRHLD